MRRTCNATLAMRRMAERMGLEVVKVGAQKYTIPGFIDHPINAKRCLARMVRLAQFSTDSGGRIGDPNALLESGTLLERGEILPSQG